MHTLWSLFGSFIAAYFLSRAIARVLPPMSSGLGRLMLVHFLSWFAIAIIVGFAKAYFTPFAWRETIILIGPQLLWFGVDWLRGKTGYTRSRRR